MDWIKSKLKRCLSNFLLFSTFIVKVALIIGLVILFCVGNAKVGTDQMGLVGMIPLAILAFFLTLKYQSVGRDEIVQELPNRVKAMTYTVLILVAAFFLMVISYGVNRVIDEYNASTIDFNQYILHDAASISLFFYIVDLVFEKSFYMITYKGVSNCQANGKDGKYTWKYLLFAMLRTFDVVIFFALFYLIFFIFKNGIYHTVQGGGIIFIFVIILAIVPFVLDFIFVRYYAERFKEITTLEDEIAEKERKEREEENKKRLHELYVKEKIRHDNTKLITGCRYVYYDFMKGFIEDVNQLVEDKYIKSEFPEYADLNLGRVIGTYNFTDFYGINGDIKSYKWIIKYKLETLKNGEYQLNIHLNLKNETEYTMRFTNLSAYTSQAHSIENEAKLKAYKEYKKAPKFLTEDQYIEDENSLFPERIDAALSVSDFEEAELEKRKKEIEIEKKKAAISKAIQRRDAAKNYFAHLSDFVGSEFNRVQVFKMDFEKDTAIEIKRLKLSFGEIEYINYKPVQNEMTFVKK